MRELPETIWTIGHSSRPWGEFLALLRSHGIAAIADVRRYPGSRAHPQFNAEPLARALQGAGVRYRPYPQLGGRRRAAAHSPNRVWRHPAFRGYADYMASAAYGAALAELLACAQAQPTALMCSEAVWWRCHRSLIADDLKCRGVRVLHIMDAHKAVEHPLTSPARCKGGRVRYDGG